MTESKSRFLKQEERPHQEDFTYHGYVINTKEYL